MNLTPEQVEAVRRGETVRVAEAGAEVVVLRADIYDRLRAVVDGVTRRAGWDDPALDAYERYRKTS
jgi:hypothetical protein